MKLYLPALEQAGSYRSSLCTALAGYLQPVSMLVLRGSGSEMAIWQQALSSRYLPDAFSKPLTDKINAWLCQGTQCLPPIT